MIFGHHQFVGLAKFHLQGLHLMLVAPSFGFPLLLGRLPEMLQRLARLAVFLLQRLGVDGLFGQSRLQARGPLFQGADRDGPFVQFGLSPDKAKIRTLFA